MLRASAVLVCLGFAACGKAPAPAVPVPTLVSSKAIEIPAWMAPMLDRTLTEADFDVIRTRLMRDSSDRAVFAGLRALATAKDERARKLADDYIGHGSEIAASVGAGTSRGDTPPGVAWSVADVRLGDASQIPLTGTCEGLFLRVAPVLVPARAGATVMDEVAFSRSSELLTRRGETLGGGGPGDQARLWAYACVTFGTQGYNVAFCTRVLSDTVVRVWVRNWPDPER